MVQKITNRVLEVADNELENVGPCEYKTKLQAEKVNLENGKYDSRTILQQILTLVDALSYTRSLT